MSIGSQCEEPGKPSKTILFTDKTRRLSVTQEVKTKNIDIDEYNLKRYHLSRVDHPQDNLVYSQNYQVLMFLNVLYLI